MKKTRTVTAQGNTGRRMRFALSALSLVSVLLPAAGGAAATLIASGLQGGSGSTVGPDGALYVTETMVGRISRIDPATGAISTYFEGLPPSEIGLGGAMDVVFLGDTAYVLVTLVHFSGQHIDGVYRIDGANEYTVIADLGAWSVANPPDPSFQVFVPEGLQYALQSYRGGFLVTDGHLNRVLHVTSGGGISEFAAFGNIVPTGLEVVGNTVYMAQAGHTPHTPADGSKVIAIDHRTRETTDVASGAPLLVDVERGRGRTMFALAQGDWNDVEEGTPAIPGTGSLVELNSDGSMRTVEAGLTWPTSLEIIGNTAYVVTLDGNVWRVDSIDAPPFGRKQP